MKIHPVLQGDAAWLRLRLGRVTASDMDRLVTPEFKLRTGEMPHTYLCEKLAEAWIGNPIAQFSTWETEQGQILEDEARRWYAFEFDDHKVQNVGFIEGDDSRCGCSPDALLGDDGGLELKCCQYTAHLKHFLAGTLPKDYAAQVHMSLYVTGRPWWRFVSYRRGFPPFVRTVERDEKIMATIAEALTSFYEKFDAAFDRLNEAAGTNKPNPMRANL